ncbi:MAG: PIG-L family deacetylase [bacterium]|nr:PIG-L family deacetylase [bacterium]
MPEVAILAVFAHPDDLELTVGGTMLRMKSLGYTTGGLDVTRGEMGTRGTVEGRAKEAEDAAKILRLDIRQNLGLADGHVFVDDPSRTAMVRAFRRLKPKVILTHQLDDPHPDHDHIANLVREAARLASMRNYVRTQAQMPSRFQGSLTTSSRVGSSPRSSSIHPIFWQTRWRRSGLMRRSSTIPTRPSPKRD